MAALCRTRNPGGAEIATDFNRNVSGRGVAALPTVHTFAYKQLVRFVVGLMACLAIAAISFSMLLAWCGG